MGSSQEMSDDELFGPPVPTPPAIDLNQKKLVLAGTSKPVDVVVNKDLQIEVRASSVPRFLQCPSNIRLPRQVKVSTKQAKLGTAFHTICDCIVRGEDFSEQKVADEHGVDVVEVRKLTWAALKMWEQQGPSFPAAKTEVNLGSLILRHEDQSCRITGHADVVSVPGDGTVRIFVWKTGWKIGADYIPQLRTYALLMYRHLQALEVDVYMASVTVGWLRDRSCETVHFTVEELDEWEKTLHKAFIDSMNDTFQAGEHCDYCPAVSQCLIQKQRLAYFIPSETRIDITSENAIAMWGLTGEVMQRCGEVRAVIKGYVNEAGGSIQGGDGRALMLRDTVKKTYTVTPDVLDMLLNYVDSSAFGQFLKIGKTALLKAVGAAAEKGTKGKRQEEVLDSMEAMGAFSEKASKTMVYGRVGEALPEAEENE